MKRIALSGAPGSGKTDLANTLRDARADHTFVLDQYVEGLRDRTGWSYGYYGGWVANLNVALTRLTQETRESLFALDYFDEGNDEILQVTCGTLVDTIAYTATTMNVNHVDLVDAGNDDYRRVANTMTILGMLVHDTWPDHYDLTFYLETSSEDPLDQHLGREILAAFETLGIPYVPLPAGLDERVEMVTDLLEPGEPPAPVER